LPVSYRRPVFERGPMIRRSHNPVAGAQEDIGGYGKQAQQRSLLDCSR